MPATDQPKSAEETAAARPDQDAMEVKALARAVLDRSVRPRAASIRRLAEAVLAQGRKGGGKKGGGKKGKKKAREAGAAKLARIPGQKGRNKGG